MCNKCIFSDVQKTGETDFDEIPKLIYGDCGSGCTQKMKEQQCDSFLAGGSYILMPKMCSVLSFPNEKRSY